MPRIEFKGGEAGAGEWVPLPKGTYAFRIDSVQPTVSKRTQSPTLRVDMTVVEGPYEGRSAVDWFSRKPTAGWRIANLLEATIPDQFDQVETGETDAKNKPLYDYGFDTEDLEGSVLLVDVEVGKTDTGSERNEFKNHRAYPVDDGPAPEDEAAPDKEEAKPTRVARRRTLKSN
jgi:hypothetical protein